VDDDPLEGHERVVFIVLLVVLFAVVLVMALRALFT
jgi:hypothetical protein